MKGLPAPERALAVRAETGLARPGTLPKPRSAIRRWRDRNRTGRMMVVVPFSNLDHLWSDTGWLDGRQWLWESADNTFINAAYFEPLPDGEGVPPILVTDHKERCGNCGELAVAVMLPWSRTHQDRGKRVGTFRQGFFTCQNWHPWPWPRVEYVKANLSIWMLTSPGDVFVHLKERGEG